MSKLNIVIIEGTNRKRRRSYNVARLIKNVGDSFHEIDTILVDPLDFNFPVDGSDEENKDPKYTEIVKNADGFFVVIPEYNHSFPGSLKTLMDSELKLYIHKPIAFAGVAEANWGGVRGVESFVNVVREYGMVASSVDVQFPNVSKLFDLEGNLLDLKYIERVKRSYRELIWLTKALKWGSENLN